MSRFLLPLFWLLCVGVQAASRHVENNRLISDNEPPLRLSVAKELPFIGKVPFVLRGVAQGERYIFAETDSAKRITRMLVVQFEGFLPQVDDYYKYSLGRTPMRLGKHDYRHNVWAWDSSAEVKQSPGSESAAMQRLLDAKGLKLDDQLVMSRFARAVGEDKRHEIIFFYIEPLTPYGYKVTDFDFEKPLAGKQAEWEKQFRERSLKMFSVAE